MKTLDHILGRGAYYGVCIVMIVVIAWVLCEAISTCSDWLGELYYALFANRDKGPACQCGHGFCFHDRRTLKCQKVACTCARYYNSADMPPDGPEASSEPLEPLPDMHDCQCPVEQPDDLPRRLPMRTLDEDDPDSFLNDPEMIRWAQRKVRN